MGDWNDNENAGYQGQPQYIQPDMNQQWQGQPQYVQPNMNQQWQGQPQYVQPNMNQQWQGQPQYIQPDMNQQWQNTPDMGNLGYGYTPGDMKKGSMHIPNIINIVGIILCIAAVFIPYAHMNSETKSIYTVFGISVITVIVAAVMIIADVICAFLDKVPAYIADLVISVIIGGAFICEFILAVIDLNKLDSTIDAGFSVGAWFSLFAAVVLIVSAPMWWFISSKKRI